MYSGIRKFNFNLKIFNHTEFNTFINDYIIEINVSSKMLCVLP